MIDTVHVAVLFHDDGTYAGEERGPDPENANRILDEHRENGGDGHLGG